MNRQEKAAFALRAEGYNSAEDLPISSIWGAHHDRNRDICQMVLFDGVTLRAAAEIAGVSRERARTVALMSTKKTIGRFE